MSFLRLLLRPLRARVDLGLIFHYDLSLPVQDFRADLPVEMKEANRAEVDEAAGLADPALAPKFAARLADGMVCYVAKVDGRVIAYNWARYRSGEDEGDSIVLGSREVYTTDAFTAPKFRGRKVHTQTLAFIMQTAKAKGYSDIWTLVSARRRDSWKTHRRLGWRRSGIVLRVRVRDLIRLRARSPYVVLACVGSPRPLAMRRSGQAAATPG